MKIAPLTLLLCFLFCSLSQGEITPERKKQLIARYYESGTSSFDVRKLTGGEKQFLITFIREQIVNDPSERNNIRSTSNEALVVLGDQEVTTRFLAHYRESGLDGGTLVESYDPKFIEILSADLFHEDPWPPPPLQPYEDQPVLPLSYRACQVIELLLADSPSFSKEVNQWATRNFKYDPRLHFVGMPERRATLRKWWKENEQFFRNKEYNSVKPGAELVEAQASTNPTERPQAPSPRSGPDTRSVSDRNQAASQQSPSTSHFLFPLLFAAFAVLIGGVFFFRKVGRR